MFNSSNRIIIVDDVESQLLDLAKAFLINGIACKTILYDQEYDDPLTGVRLAFFDITLTGKVIDLDLEVFDYKTDRTLSSVFNDLAIGIRNCVSSSNGPFALVFWSKNTKVVPNFIEYVNERFQDLPSPILIDTLNKTDFINKSPEEIKEKIDQIFVNKPVKLLFDFESKCEKAAINTVNEIIKVIPNDSDGNKWPDYMLFDKNFGLIFSSIAKATLGNEHAKINTDRAVYEALLPMMNYKILCNAATESDWEQHLQSIDNSKLQYPEGFSEGMLNSIFHIDNTSKIDYLTRGAVFEYNILPIPFEIAYYFRLSKYFKKLETFISDYFFRLKEQSSVELKDLILKKSKFIVVEISSSCDYSQNKKRNPKYLLGLHTPRINKEDIEEKSLSDSVFFKDLPVFNLNGEEFILWFNFNFVISNTFKVKRFGTPLFILKKELIDMIGNRYANHVSRIGITSF